MKFGIKFPIKEVQFGKSVNMLDLNCSVEEDNMIQYQGYTKPTDSKRYLSPKSFHPRFVFDSVPFSQLLRTLRNNSKVETRTVQLEQCVKDFVNSGYEEKELLELKGKAIMKTNINSERNTEEELVFPVHYFDKLKDFKTVVHSMNNEIKELIGDTRVMFAIKKQGSIGNMMVQNKQLSIKPNTIANDQKCNAPGCRQCPLVNKERRLVINGNPLVIPRFYSCKSKNIIYLWNCKLCDENYFGRTIQACHNRTSGHRSCFNNIDKVDKSALSMHANDCHQNDFTLDSFKISVVKKVSPQQLRREEFKYIDKFKTVPKGLNRYKS